MPGWPAHPPRLRPQPVGALLLEHCRVTQEEPASFSISECAGVTPSSAPPLPGNRVRRPGWDSSLLGQAVRSRPSHALAVPPAAKTSSSPLGIPAFWVFPAVISPVPSGLAPATLVDFLGSPGEGRISRESKSFD